MMMSLFVKPLKKFNLPITSRQPSNAGGFWRVVFNKPINDKGKQRKEQVNPALRLPAGR
jgi:hypothetical protein